MAASVIFIRATRTNIRSHAITRQTFLISPLSFRCLAGSSHRVTPALRNYASKSFPSHTIISMPALSPTMQSGNIGTWQKKVGDTLAPGDVLVEIETDKAQMDFEFQEEGILAKVLKDSGEKDVAVGSPIAVMVEESDDVPAFESFTMDDAGGDKSPPQDPPDHEASEASEPPSNSSGTAPASPETPMESQTGESESTGAKLETSLERQPNVSPTVKRLALEKGISIKQLKGTGPGGRITKEDVEKCQPTGPTIGGPMSSPMASTPYEDVPANSMRKTIATRLTQSMNQNPHYYVSTTVSVSKLLKLRQALNSSAEGAYRLSVNDFMVKALAIACRKVPEANSSWREEGNQTVIRQHHIVDVSVAVATPVGLMTPIVRNVNAIGLSDISSQIKELGKRARDGKLKPEEYQGGTVTISNMGMNEAVERFTAVINPPQAMILAVGTTKKVAIPVENAEGATEVEWDDQITLTGSFDHKVVDGAIGGELMKALKRVIENPLNMVL